MKLLGIESSRIIYLMQARRPSGQLYLPDAVSKLVKRYSFVKSPGPEQALPLTFNIGKFRETQISELSVYNDGLIISSASDTDILDAFLNDFLGWATRSLALSPWNYRSPKNSTKAALSCNPRLTSHHARLVCPTTSTKRFLPR